MSSKALLSAGAVVAILGLAVGAQMLSRSSSPKPVEVARPTPAQEDLEDPQGLNRRNRAAFVSVAPDSSEKDERPTLRVGRATTVTTATRTEDFEMQKERATGNRDISGMVRARREGPPQNPGPGEAGRGPGGWGRDNQQRVAGATIEIYENDPDTKNPPLKTAVSDEEGSFTITGINDQSMRYIAIARKDGYAPVVNRLTLDERRELLFFFMTTGTQVTGKVLDDETSAPIAGATVIYPSQGEPMRLLGETVTDANGNWSFDSVVPGPAVARASKDGYADGTGRGRVGREEIIIRMKEGAAVVRGRGVLRATKKPAVGARIVVQLEDGTRRSMLTDEEGNFEFRNLPEGEHELFGTRRGIDSERTELTLERSAVKENLEVVLPDDLLVQGRVVKAPSDVAFPGVRVRYRGERGQESVLTGADGSFAFEVASLDSYGIEVKEKGWEAEVVQPKKKDESTTVAVFAPERLNRELESADSSSDRLLIRMKPTDTISGRVFTQNRFGGRGDQQGPQEATLGDNRTPARNANITIDAKIGDSMQRLITRADTNGEFFVNLSELGGERSGDARVLASWGGSVGAANVRTNSSEPVEIVLQNSRLSARLELSDGTPLSDVRVEMRSYIRPGSPEGENNAALPSVTQYTRQNGSFTAGLVPTQPYTFSFEMPDGQKITKTYAKASDIMPRALFIYDPVVSDIVVVKDEARNRRGGDGQAGTGERRGGGRGPGEAQNPGGAQDRPRRSEGNGQQPGGPGGPGGWRGGGPGGPGRGGSLNP